MTRADRIARFAKCGDAVAMQIRPPTWELASVCPCCDQGGLTFSSCPRCQHVLLICAEVNTVFPHPRDLTRSFEGELGVQRCPACASTTLEDYVPATSEQIKALGFAPGEYV